MLRISVMILIISILPIAAIGAGPAVYVVNSLGETLSMIDVTTGEVTNDILTLGSDVQCAPNQIVVRDTLAYVVVSLTDEIQIIDLNSQTTIDFINTGAGTNPYWMAFYDDQYAYVTTLQSNSLAKVDFETGTVVHEQEVGVAPEGIVIHKQKAYVAITALDYATYAYGQGQVVVYDLQGDSILSRIDVGTNPQYLAVDSADRVHVACTGNYWSAFGIVYVIDPTTDTVVDSLAVGGSPGGITIGPDNVAYLAAGGWVDAGHMYSYDAQILTVFNDVNDPLIVSYGCMGAVAFQSGDVYSVSFDDAIDVTDTSGVISVTYSVGDGPVHLDFNYMPGDIDGDWFVDLGDLTRLISWLYITFEEPPYPIWRANINGDFQYDLGDLTHLIGYLFLDGPKPMAGPVWVRPH